MTRITIFQAAGILALMCVSEVCYAYNKTTTGPATTTVSTITTMGPATISESNMTTTVSNITTMGPATITESNMTTTVSTITTMEPATITESIMTTTVSNMTTTASNMTTESGATSTIPSNLTPGARWQVKDMGGKLCMLMDFGGTITDVINGVTVKIPSDASTSKSDCSSSSYSAFVLDFNTLFTKWEIVLNYTIGEDSFKLHTLAASRSTLETPLSSSETTDFFNVPVGDYYTCSHFNYSIGFFQLNLTNPSLQPFVQKTEEGDNLGQPYVCRPAQSDSYTTMELDRNTVIGLGVGIPSGLICLAIVVVKSCKREQSCCDCTMCVRCKICVNCTICGNCCNKTKNLQDPLLHSYGRAY